MSNCLRILTVAAALFTLGFTGSASACGFHAQLKGGFKVSYPGSLEVAINVANARRSRLLHDGFRRQYSSAAQFQRTMLDLQRLPARLAQMRPRLSRTSPLKFSLILVGPSLWSTFDVRTNMTLARFHETGPADGAAVVLTHHVVLRELLDGSLPITAAIDRRLVAFSGSNSGAVRQLFEASFQIDRHQAAVRN